MKTFNNILEEAILKNTNDRAALQTSRNVLKQLDSVVKDVDRGAMTEEQAGKILMQLKKDIVTALKAIAKVK